MARFSRRRVTLLLDGDEAEPLMVDDVDDALVQRLLDDAPPGRIVSIQPG